MALPADYHMHTVLCHHATGVPTEYAAHALSLGMTEIGFSEHNPMWRDDYDDWHMDQADLDNYVGLVKQARRDHPSLSIKMALEMDYFPGKEDWVKGLADRHPWDYMIGAVHYVSDTWDLDNPKRLSEWRSRDAFEVWTAYFQRLTMAAQSGLFDIIAHADLCKKFCFVPKQDCTHLFKDLLTAIKDNDLCMELNTAGLRKDCREIYPCPALVKLAFAMGVPITFASDAHTATEVGMNFTDAVALAKDAGYTTYCQFTQGERRVAPIEV